MDPNGYNYQGYLNTEIFNYGHSYGQAMHHLMNQPEIREQDYYRDDYPSPNNRQMRQLYHHNDQYGNRGYQSHNVPYVDERIPFGMSQTTEYASEQISVDIRLSSSRYIDSELINELRRKDLSCAVQGHRVITVTGYPVNSRRGAGEFLAAVKEISLDYGASIVHY